MSFEAKIPDQIAELQNKKTDLARQRVHLLHDCDCNFCEWNGDVTEDNETEWGRLALEIKGLDQLIDRLKDHAKLHKIEIKAEK